MLLTITPTIRNEWRTRCISNVIPALADVPWDTTSTINVGSVVAAAIRADCATHIDPWGSDTLAEARSAYRALIKQIDAATSI